MTLAKGDVIKRAETTKEARLWRVAKEGDVEE
jgi:hypothetical protein